MWTVATRTFWPTCGYGFTVCVFAIEIRLAAFIIAKITTTFERDSLFTFAAWLSRRTLAAFSA
jgi:hypothetical protein